MNILYLFNMVKDDCLENLPIEALPLTGLENHNINNRKASEYTLLL